jgi:flagellar FlgN protein
MVTGSAESPLTGLEAVLVPLVPALERLHDAQVEQRRVIVGGDLTSIVTANTTIEAASARVATLEHRRQTIQEQLEASLGVQGLRAVLETATVDPADRTRLGQQLGHVAQLVRTLREQGRQNAELLDAAIKLARRTRVTLERLGGTEPTYDSVKTRRHLAAQRARAALRHHPSPQVSPATS